VNYYFDPTGIQS